MIFSCVVIESVWYDREAYRDGGISLACGLCIKMHHHKQTFDLFKPLPTISVCVCVCVCVCALLRSSLYLELIIPTLVQLSCVGVCRALDDDAWDDLMLAYGICCLLSLVLQDMA